VACDDTGPEGDVGTPSSEHAAVALPLRKAPAWIDRYCHEAADDLGYPVICPRRLPRPLTIISCEGPDPKSPRWTDHCFDYVLDVLFRGAPGYRGPFWTAPRTGHLAVWAIGPHSQFNRGGQLVGCPGGGRRAQPERLLGNSGFWWECPTSPAGANLNSGHVAFQWRAGGVVYGLSLHRISEVNRQFVRVLLEHADLVLPRL
jgi:hypothetical protein